MAILITSIRHLRALIYVIAAKSIHVETVPNSTAAVVGADGVVAILGALVCTLSTLINIWMGKGCKVIFAGQKYLSWWQRRKKEEKAY